MRLTPPPALPQIQIGGTAVVEGLMRPLGVIEPKIVGNPVAGISWMAIVGQVDLLIFQAAPETLGKDVIQCPTLAIHTDLDADCFERLCDLRTGEMTALICIRWTQCQAQLLGQFSVWVPPVTLMKRLTPGLKARAGYSDPGRGRCTPPAPKNAIDTASGPTPDTDRRDGGSRGPDAAARCYRT